MQKGFLTWSGIQQEIAGDDVTLPLPISMWGFKGVDRLTI